MFLKQNGVKHIRCAPYHPSSNGLAERFVQTFKTAMKVNGANSSNLSQKLNSFLLSYRNTPHTTTNEAPSTLSLGRRPRSLFDLLRPSVNKTVFDHQTQQKKTMMLMPGSESVWLENKFWLMTPGIRRGKVWSRKEVAQPLTA